MTLTRQAYASPAGNDAAPGTIDQPVRTVLRGIELVRTGGVVNLRAGTYREFLTVDGVTPAPPACLVVRSFPGEHATIDGALELFRQVPNQDWEPVPGGHRDEFRSTQVFPVSPAEGEPERAAFVDREPYTRLITYSRIEDFRADNETFAKIPHSDPRPGPTVHPEPADEDERRRPWVYMGPGIHFDRATRRLHIRLSHTHNGIAGLADYDGPVDPRTVPIAVTRTDTATVRLRDCAAITFQDLTLRFGGRETVRVARSHDVVFDHVRILAGSRAVWLGHDNRRTVFRHCEMRGGSPTWFFRSDRKDTYTFTHTDGTTQHNELGEHTSSVLFSGRGTNRDTLVHHCEFLDAHDLYLFGEGTRFHDNWIHNLNDDALALDAADPTTDTSVWRNVATRCLTGISYGTNHVSGQARVFRNLIDLREPVAGVRPRFVGDKAVFRQGIFYKSNGVDGPLDLFHNTCLVFAPGVRRASFDEPVPQAPLFDNATAVAFGHYGSSEGGRRRSINNLFVAVNPYPESDAPAAFLPAPTFPGPTDGNCYARLGHTTAKLLRLKAYVDDTGVPQAGATFDLDEFRQAGNPPFEQSKAQYSPGYEASSTAQDPAFSSLGADGLPRPTDDLRPGSLLGRGIVLPLELLKLDPFAPGTIPVLEQIPPDVGCYQQSEPVLQTGVDGRRSYPDV